MAHKKKFIAVLSILGCMAAVSAGLGVRVAINGSAKSSYGDAFVYSEETPLKYQSYASASVSDRKGLLLFGYENGGTADFKGTFNGVFETEMYAVAQSSTADLRKYSLVFTDNATKQSFSVNVATGLDSSTCSVTFNGEKAGIWYYNSEYVTNGLCGYTAAYNAEEKYTEFSVNGISAIRFDPVAKQVMVKGGSEAYKLVWDFSNESNDGRVLQNDLSVFEDYSVKIVFDEIKTNGKGELLLYTFGGHNFNSRFIEESLRVSATLGAKALVGETYTLPKANVNDLLLGNLSSDEVSVTVYNEEGKIVNENGAYAFCPETAGNYYVYYSYGDEVATAYYLLEALNETDIVFEFVYEKEEAFLPALGLHASMYIPKATLESTLLNSSAAENTSVTIFKDGKPVPDYENVSGGFTYSFDEYGEYTVQYKTSQLGDAVTDERKINVTKDVAGVVAEEVPAIMDFGATFRLTPATVYFDGKELTAKATLTYPSGKETVATSVSEVTLDELGIYTLTQDWTGGSTETEFSVNNTYQSLFSDPTAAEYGALKLNQSYSGQIVTLQNNVALTYNKLIDLSDNVFDDALEDKTQNTPLVELVVQPNAIGQKDMTALYIEFVDAYDPTNFISIRVRYFDYAPKISRIRTKATGQGWVGYYYQFLTAELEVNDAPSHEDGGMVTNASFTQSATGKNFEESVLRLYFDNQENALYAKPDQETSHDGLNTPVPWLVRDYDSTDLKLGAGDTPWRGFTTGEVYMRIYATGVSDSANIAILNVDGDVLSDKYMDDQEAPTINVDLGNDDSAPLAKVGTPYTIFDYSVYDTYTGTYSLEPKVYFGNSEVAIADGKFTPDREGTYTIVYTGCDYYGNEAIKKIEVEARRTIDKPELVKTDSLPSNAAYGQKLTVPEFSGSGGAGGIVTDVQVTLNGKNVELEYGAFRCLSEGVYIIKYTVTDYVGGMARETEYITVSRSDKPVFDEDQLSLPPVFLAGETYTLETYTAYYYGENGAEAVVSRISMYDETTGEWKAIENGAYTPSYTDGGKTAKLRYTFERNGAEQVYEKEVPIVFVNVGYAGFMADYFTGDNVTLTCADGLRFDIAEGESGTVSFVRPIDVKHLEFSFAIKGERLAQAFDTFSIKLTDANDPTLCVVLTVQNTASGYYIRINDGARKAFGVELDGDFSIAFDHETSSFTDIYDYALGTVETYKNGKQFVGFPSGSVYAEFTVTGAKEAPVALLQIANQNFNDTYYDYNQPLITINGYVSGSYDIGDEIVLPTATAYDVFSNVEDVKVMVKIGSTTVFRNLSASVTQKFTISEYGTYQIIYTAQDADGNVATLNRYVTCFDRVKPELEFSGSFITEAKSGDTFALPQYTVKDNGDVSKVIVETYFCTPDGIMYACDGKEVTFTGTGTYVIYYQLIDENDNTAFYAFSVVVR